MPSVKSIVNRVTGVNRSRTTNKARAQRRKNIRNVFRRKSSGGQGG